MKTKNLTRIYFAGIACCVIAFGFSVMYMLNPDFYALFLTFVFGGIGAFAGAGLALLAVYLCCVKQ